ncbi:uncharacterized protein [Diabrotica undecimpunctata]|uniref:uncharacterized protein n=1 Tax=Diabrotica undecimpunctata TaxID=50387 RepID=UPI003B633978
MYSQRTKRIMNALQKNECCKKELFNEENNVPLTEPITSTDTKKTELTTSSHKMRDHSQSFELAEDIKIKSTFVELADSSSRKLPVSSTSNKTNGKRQKLENTEDTKNSERLFGDLVVAMLREKPESERNRCMVQIMTILSK